MLQHYKDHAITLLAGLDEDTGAFAPEASITWKTGAVNRIEHSFTSSILCASRVWALALALDEAKSWIDRGSPITE